MSVWISPAACHAVRPRRRCQDCAGLASPAVKNAISSSSANASRTTRSRPDSLGGWASPTPARAHRRRVLVVELRQLGLDARGDRHRARALRRRVRGDLRGHLLRALVDVRDEQHRLGRQRAEVAGGVRRLLGHGHACAPGRPPAAPRSPRAATPPRRPRRGRRRAPVWPTRSTRRSACSRSASTSSVSIVSMSASGSTRPSGCTTPHRRVRAHDVHDRVGLADVRQEAVAQALALVRAGDEPGDVVEVDRVPHDLRGADRLRHLLQALVAHRHDRDVRLDRRERVVGRLRPRFGERVEQRGLARVGHPHDADPRAHGAAPVSRPSCSGTQRPPANAATHERPQQRPASTSEG